MPQYWLCYGSLWIWLFTAFLLEYDVHPCSQCRFSEMQGSHNFKSVKESSTRKWLNIGSPSMLFKWLSVDFKTATRIGIFASIKSKPLLSDARAIFTWKYKIHLKNLMRWIQKALYLASSILLALMRVSMYMDQISVRFGKLLKAFSNIVRPRSASPWENSSWPNLAITSRSTTRRWNITFLIVRDDRHWQV